MTAPDYFYPNQKSIFGITQTNPVVITTFNAHNYLNGLVVRIFLPLPSPSAPFVGPIPSLGMPQINGLSGKVTVLSPTTFSLPIDSSSFDAYVVGALPKNDACLGQAIPIAEDALTLTSATQNNNTVFPEIYGTSPSPSYPILPP
jgi:hypothetical protein